MEFDEKKWEEIAKLKESLRDREQKEIERLEELEKMPFHLRIQQEGQEEQLERVKAVQEETFFKKYAEMENVGDLFNEFWLLFLNGKIDSIKHFMELKQ